MKRLKKILKAVAFCITVVLVAGLGLGFLAARRSVIRDNINMSSSCMDTMDGMDMGGMDMGNMDMSTMHMCPVPMGIPDPGATPIASLDTPPSSAPVRVFTLTAKMASLDLGNGKHVEAYTFNGAVPGPELRVQQGDLVVVTLLNKLPVSTTIHWHGISSPNAEDGVAGLTQDAVKPGGSYTYRFIASDAGTFWYHSHQETSIQLPLGLYGAIVVEPKAPAVRYDRDYTLFLHEWGAGLHEGLLGPFGCHATCPETLTINDRADKISLAAWPGETVRLRVANSGNDVHFPVLVGAPFEVIALDGHDLNGPTALSNTAVPIGPAQRFDVSFVMPSSGAVALIDDDPRADAPPAQHPMVVFGAEPAERGIPAIASYPTDAALFDLSAYGAPASDALNLNSHFNVQYDMALSTMPGFFNGAFSLEFPINDQTYPNIPALKVKLGDLVSIHVHNDGGIPFPHAIHLHGHYFTVLAHNGKPLAGSPVHLDTVLVNPGESYDVAFLADNPGLWMLHCHIVEHDLRGMDMMVVYPEIYTPFTIGSASGNNPF